MNAWVYRARTSCIACVCLSITMILAGGCGVERPRTPLSYQELRSEGNVLQTHQYSCGAASLATLMSLLGTPTSEAELLDEVFESDPKLQVVTEGEDDEVFLDPLTVKNLEDLARARDFRVVSVQARSDDEGIAAIEALAPVITRLTIHDDILHFVVVRKIESGFVFISDPAYGNYRLPIRQFYEAWDAGDRIIVAVSRKAFLAHAGDEGAPGQFRVRRDPEEVIDWSGLDDRFPRPLYNAARRSITLTNSLSR